MAISMFILSKNNKPNNTIKPLKNNEKKNTIASLNENLKSILNDSIPFHSNKYESKYFDDPQYHFQYQSSISNNLKYQTDLLKKITV